MKYRENEIERVTQKIVSNYRPKTIYLFGSFAWGEPTKDSDLDFLIIKNDRKKFYERLYAVRKAIGDDYELPIDVMVYTDIEFQTATTNGDIFIKKIVTDGTKLYEKRN